MEGMKFCLRSLNHSHGWALEGSKGDGLWLPDGTGLQYEGEDALIFYAVQPGNGKALHGITP